MEALAGSGRRVNADRKSVLAGRRGGVRFAHRGFVEGSHWTPSMTVPPSGSDLAPLDEETPGRAEFDAALVALRAEVLGYLHGQLRDREIAADLAQETLLRMMRYRDVPAQERRYVMFHIARNLLAEYRRAQFRHRASRHVSLEDVATLEDCQASVEAIVDARRAIERLVKRVIHRLPPKCGLAFAMNRIDGLTYPQISKEMGISVKAVEKHISRALKACRAEVGDRDF
jgi:RNA polymerase sigma-70 factor (ECF subfamily)